MSPDTFAMDALVFLVGTLIGQRPGMLLAYRLTDIGKLVQHELSRMTKVRIQLAFAAATAKASSEITGLVTRDRARRLQALRLKG